jgi:hypothetical protein
VLDGFLRQSAAIACATIGGGQLRAAAHPSARRILRSAHLGVGRVNFLPLMSKTEPQLPR